MRNKGLNRNKKLCYDTHSEALLVDWLTPLVVITDWLSPSLVVV